MSTDKNNNLVQAICKIQYQFIGNVDTISIGSSKFHRVVSFINELDWLDLYHSPSSVIFEEQPSRVNAGLLYSQKISLKFPGEDEDNTELFDDLISPGIIIKLTWSNGKSKLIGSIANPVRILPDYKSDPDRTGYTINIEHKESKPAYWLESAS